MITYKHEQTHHMPSVRAYCDDQVVGVLIIRDQEILAVTVHEDFRLQGIATKMLKLAQDKYGIITMPAERTDDGDKWARSWSDHLPQRDARAIILV